MNDPYKALYIHIPFCKSKCAYCDFCSKATKSSDPEIETYIEGLVGEIFKAGRAGELKDIETVYIGGGTPTFIGTKNLTSLLYAIGLSMSLSEVEFTLEANPDSFDDRLAKDIFALGVNRISLGVQSFDDELLKCIGRPHSSEDAIRAIIHARSRFENISIDLMCGLPGQNLETFLSSINKALELEIPHISIYPLSVEDGTKMRSMLDEGKVKLSSSDVVADMMEAADALLESNGYEHYEVSNFAKPGFQSKHNLSYWQGKPYLGIGRSAVSMVQDEGGRRRIKDGEVVDTLTCKQAIVEDIMLAMRCISGVSVSSIEKLDEETFQGINSKFEALMSAGLIEIDAERYAPTLRGMMLGNEIYETVLDFF